MTLDRAQDGFREEPGTATAIEYATALLEYVGDNMIGNDTFRNGMIEIIHHITGGRSDIGGRVEIVTKAI